MILKILSKILYLVPDARCCVRSEMTESDYKSAENCKEAVYPVGEYFVLWSSTNDMPFPGADAINAVSEEQVQRREERQRKRIRNQTQKENLAIVAAYRAAKQSNPELKFSDYLDGLEVDSGDIDPDDMV
jgi:hypothetical protein